MIEKQPPAPGAIRFMSVRWTKCMLIASILAVLLCASEADAATKKKKAAAKPPDRYASIVIEAETGYVLSEKNADKKLFPASLTKIMTLYMTFEAIQSGRLTKNTRVPVSKHAAFMEPSELGLAAGSTIRVEDAIYGLVTKSANDAAVVLAEAVAGSESAFADLMTKRARQLGMKNTTFKNASGLPHKAQISSARDMALLGQAIHRDFPREYKYFSTKSFTYAGRTYASHNKLMNSYVGMDGIKTGYIHASGFNLVASAKRNGSRLVGVVFGGQTSKSRNDHMAQLLDLGFARLDDVRVASLIADRKQGAIAKPVSATTAAAIAATSGQAAPVLSAGRPQLPHFDAMGLVTEQGDRNDDKIEPTPTQLAKATLPGSLGGWAVQIGAFSTHAAGMNALKTAHQELPARLTQNAEYVIVPLMTNRGVIYRARLTGLNHNDASDACRQLKNTCLVLTAQ